MLSPDLSPASAGGDYLDQVRALIRAHGWAVQHVHQPGYDTKQHAYTVGMTGLGGPEVLVCGVPARDAGAVLNLVAPMILIGQLHVGSHVELPIGAGVRPARLAVHAGGLALVAAALYGAESVRVVEIIV